MANVFELESLEPRVLLSSDGIGAAQELLLPAEETAPVAESVPEFNRSVPTLDQSTPEADLFSEVAGEELPAGHSQGAIAKQGAAQHNTLPDLTVSNVVINSSDWAHSFRVQFTLTNAGSAAVTGEEISHSLILSKVATYTPGDWQNEIFSQYYGYQVPQDGLGAGESVNIDSATTDEETKVVISVLANDTPASGKTLNPASIMIVDTPDHGMTTIDTENGRIEYTPTTDYSGPDSLTYTVADTDGNRSDPATVNLTVNAVNDAPSIQAPASLSAAKESAKAITGITITDVDAASGNLTLTLSVTRGTLSLADDVASGLVANQITGNNTDSLSVTATLTAINATLANSGGLTYTGALNLIGSDSLQLNVNDNNNTGSGGAKSGSASVAIDVTGSPQDAWRNLHFDVATLTDPAKEASHWGDAADPDMDMQDNTYEFVADTDPNSAASKFQFQVANGASGIDLVFSPVSGARTYTVEFVGQIGQAFAPVTGGAVIDQGNIRTVNVAADAPQRFYRVRISVGE